MNRLVLAAGLLLIAGLTACGGDSAAGPQQPESPTWATDSTTSGPSSVEPVAIEPGTYRIPRSGWSVADYTVTFAQDWTVQYGHVFAQHHDEDDEFGFYAVVVDEVFADACRGENGDRVKVGPGVQAFVDALLKQSGPAKSTPVDTTLGGYPATRIDLRTPKRLKQRDCFLGPGTGVQIWYSEPADKYFVLLPDAAASVYVVDVDGKRQVFLAQVGNPGSAKDRAELQTVLDSIRIER